MLTVRRRTWGGFTLLPRTARANLPTSRSDGRSHLDLLPHSRSGRWLRRPGELRLSRLLGALALVVDADRNNQLLGNDGADEPTYLAGVVAPGRATMRATLPEALSRVQSWLSGLVFDLT